MVIKRSNKNKNNPRLSPVFIGHLLCPLFCHLPLAKADEVQSKILFIPANQNIEKFDFLWGWQGPWLWTDMATAEGTPVPKSAQY